MVAVWVEWVNTTAFIDTDHRVCDPFPWAALVRMNFIVEGDDAVKFSHAEKIHSSGCSGGDGMARIDEC